jgi:hypothetical protein
MKLEMISMTCPPVDDVGVSANPIARLLGVALFILYNFLRLKIMLILTYSRILAGKISEHLVLSAVQESTNSR